MFYPDWNQAMNLYSVLIILGGSLLLTLREFFPDTRMAYSKFNSDTKPGKTISSFHGMLTIYFPSFLLSIYYLCQPYPTLHLKVVSILLFIHYAKRVYEVCCIHNYSGHTKLIDCLSISASYIGYLVAVTYFSPQVPVVHLRNMILGCVLFLSGEYMNFCHHRILSNLRKNGSKKYVIPNAGFFQYVWCPHYTAEIITFIAMVVMTQHFMILLLQLGSAFYLSARAYNTKKWYQAKFTEIPERACLIPFLF